MIRLLFYLRKGFRFVRAIKIGLEITLQAFKSIILDHKKYFLFCAILTSSYVFRLKLTAIIDPNFSIDYFLSQSYLERSALELLIETIKFPITLQMLLTVVLKVALIFVDTFITMFIAGVVVYFNFKGQKLLQSIYHVNSKLRLILTWSIINVCFFMLTAFLPDFIGNSIELLWGLSTLLVIPILTINNNISLIELLKRSIIIFKKRLGNFLGADILIDLTFILLTALFFYLYQHERTQTFISTDIKKEINFFSLLATCYLQSVIVVTEAIVSCSLYKLLYYQKHFEK